jgi:hypothetical protein
MEINSKVRAFALHTNSEIAAKSKLEKTQRARNATERAVITKTTTTAVNDDQRSRRRWS